MCVSTETLMHSNAKMCEWSLIQPMISGLNVQVRVSPSVCVCACVRVRVCVLS